MLKTQKKPVPKEKKPFDDGWRQTLAEIDKGSDLGSTIFTSQRRSEGRNLFKSAIDWKYPVNILVNQYIPLTASRHATVFFGGELTNEATANSAYDFQTVHSRCFTGRKNMQGRSQDFLSSGANSAHLHRGLTCTDFRPIQLQEIAQQN